MYGGHVYPVGSHIPTPNPCEQCSCATDYLTQSATLRCTTTECPSVYSRTPLAPGCHYVYKKNKCCPESVHCPAAQKDNNYEVPICEYKEKMFYKGEQIYPEEDPCLVCICDEGWNGGVNSSSCRQHDCMLEKEGRRLRQGCIPIYHEKTCCPIDYHCADGDTDFKSNRSPSFKSDDDEDEMCAFEGRHYPIGHVLDIPYPTHCVTCTCKTPPDFTCIHAACPPAPDYGRCKAVYKPQACCPDYTCEEKTDDFENAKNELQNSKESDFNDALQKLIQECKEMSCGVDERCMLVKQKCDSEPCLQVAQCEKVSFGCGQKTCSDGCQEIGSYEGYCPICYCKEQLQKPQYELTCRVQSCEENCVLIGRDEGGCPICQCPQGNLEERACAPAQCRGFNCTLSVNALGCAECRCQLSCKPRECPAGCEMDLDDPDNTGLQCGCQCANSTTAMEYVLSRSVSEICGPVSCKGLNCSVSEDRTGCPSCQCKVPCSVPVCQKGCELEKDTGHLGRCPGCVCKLSRSARDSNVAEKDCPPPTCFGYNCSVITGKDGCQVCLCESPCEEAPKCPSHCKLEVNVPEGRCRGCVCSYGDDPAHKPSRGGGKVPDTPSDELMSERREDLDADFIPLPGKDLVPEVDHLYLNHPAFHYAGLGEPLESALYHDDVESRLPEEAREEPDTETHDYDDFAEEKTLPDDEEGKCAQKNCPEGQKCVIRRLQCIRTPCPTIPVCIDVEPRCPIPMCAIGCMVMKWDDEVCPSCFCGIIRGAEGRVCPRTRCMGKRCYNVIGDDGCPQCKCDSICIPPKCYDGCHIEKDPPAGKCPVCTCPAVRQPIIPEPSTETVTTQSTELAETTTPTVFNQEESTTILPAVSPDDIQGRHPFDNSEGRPDMIDRNQAHDHEDVSVDLYDSLAEIEEKVKSENEDRTTEHTTITVNLPTTIDASDVFGISTQDDVTVTPHEAVTYTESTSSNFITFPPHPLSDPITTKKPCLEKPTSDVEGTVPTKTDDEVLKSTVKPLEMNIFKTSEKKPDNKPDIYVLKPVNDKNVSEKESTTLKPAADTFNLNIYKTSDETSNLKPNIYQLKPFHEQQAPKRASTTPKPSVSPIDMNIFEEKPDIYVLKPVQVSTTQETIVAGGTFESTNPENEDTTHKDSVKPILQNLQQLMSNLYEVVSSQKRPENTENPNFDENFNIENISPVHKTTISDISISEVNDKFSTNEQVNDVKLLESKRTTQIYNQNEAGESLFQGDSAVSQNTEPVLNGQVSQSNSASNQQALLQQGVNSHLHIFPHYPFQNPSNNFQTVSILPNTFHNPLQSLYNGGVQGSVFNGQHQNAYISSIQQPQQQFIAFQQAQSPSPNNQQLLLTHIPIPSSLQQQLSAGTQTLGLLHHLFNQQQFLNIQKPIHVDKKEGDTTEETESLDNKRPEATSQFEHAYQNDKPQQNHQFFQVPVVGAQNVIPGFLFPSEGQQNVLGQSPQQQYAIIQTSDAPVEIAEPVKKTQDNHKPIVSQSSEYENSQLSESSSDSEMETLVLHQFDHHAPQTHQNPVIQIHNLSPSHDQQQVGITDTIHKTDVEKLEPAIQSFDTKEKLGYENQQSNIFVPAAMPQFELSELKPADSTSQTIAQVQHQVSTQLQQDLVSQNGQAFNQNLQQSLNQNVQDFHQQSHQPIGQNGQIFQQQSQKPLSQNTQVLHQQSQQPLSQNGHIFHQQSQEQPLNQNGQVVLQQSQQQLLNQNAQTFHQQSYQQPLNQNGQDIHHQLHQQQPIIQNGQSFYQQLHQQPFHQNAQFVLQQTQQQNPLNTFTANQPDLMQSDQPQIPLQEPSAVHVSDNQPQILFENNKHSQQPALINIQSNQHSINSNQHKPEDFQSEPSQQVPQHQINSEHEFPPQQQNIIPHNASPHGILTNAFSQNTQTSSSNTDYYSQSQQAINGNQIPHQAFDINNGQSIVQNVTETTNLPVNDGKPTTFSQHSNIQMNQYQTYPQQPFINFGFQNPMQLQQQNQIYQQYANQIGNPNLPSYQPQITNSQLPHQHVLPQIQSFNNQFYQQYQPHHQQIYHPHGQIYNQQQHQYIQNQYYKPSAVPPTHMQSVNAPFQQQQFTNPYAQQYQQLIQPTTSFTTYNNLPQTNVNDNQNEHASQLLAEHPISEEVLTGAESQLQLHSDEKDSQIVGQQFESSVSDSHLFENGASELQQHSDEKKNQAVSQQFELLETHAFPHKDGIPQQQIQQDGQSDEEDFKIESNVNQFSSQQNTLPSAQAEISEQQHIDDTYLALKPIAQVVTSETHIEQEDDTILNKDTSLQHAEEQSNYNDEQTEESFSQQSVAPLLPETTLNSHSVKSRPGSIYRPHFAALTSTITPKTTTTTTTTAEPPPSSTNNHDLFPAPSRPLNNPQIHQEDWVDQVFVEEEDPIQTEYEDIDDPEITTLPSSTTTPPAPTPFLYPQSQQQEEEILENFDNHQPGSLIGRPMHQQQVSGETSPRPIYTVLTTTTKLPLVTDISASLPIVSPTAEAYAGSHKQPSSQDEPYQCPTPHCNGYNCSLIRGHDGCQKCVCDSPCAPCPPNCVKTKTSSEGRCPVCDCTVAPSLASSEPQCPVVNCRGSNCRTVKNSNGCSTCICDPKCAEPQCDPGCEILRDVPPGQCPGCVCRVTVVQAVVQKSKTCPPLSCSKSCNKTKGPDGCTQCICGINRACGTPKCDPGCQLQTSAAAGHCPACVCPTFMDDVTTSVEPVLHLQHPQEPDQDSIKTVQQFPLQQQNPVTFSSNLDEEEEETMSTLHTTVTVDLESDETTKCPPPVCSGLRCSTETTENGCEVCKCKYKCPNPKCVGNCYPETNAPQHRCPGCVCPKAPKY